MIDPNELQDQGSPDDGGAAVLDDLHTLRARAQERDQFLELAKRTQADFENYQKRIQRERDQERKYINRTMALDLLPIIDNFERALQASKQAGEKGTLVDGVSMVHAQLLDMLKRQGITGIEAANQPFDPNLHQAVMQQPKPDVAPNTVVQVLEQGYVMHDRVLRPAKVIVSAGT